MASAGGSLEAGDVSVGTSIVPPGPCPPSADTPDTSPAAMKQQLTASFNDFAVSLPGTPGQAEQQASGRTPTPGISSRNSLCRNQAGNGLPELAGGSRLS